MNVLTKNRPVLDVTGLEKKPPLVGLSIDDILEVTNVRELVTVPYELLERIVIHESSLTPTARALPVRIPPPAPVPPVVRPASHAWPITVGIVVFLLTLTIALSAFKARHRLWSGAKTAAHLVAAAKTR